MTDYTDNVDTTYGTTYGANVYDATGYGTTGYGSTTALDTTAYDTTGYDTAGYGTTSLDTVGTTGTAYGGVYDNGYGSTAYDPATGAYDQRMSYRTDGSRRHHRERVSPSGVYRHRDVDHRDDGTTRVHRDYYNPNTGTSYRREYER